MLSKSGFSKFWLEQLYFPLHQVSAQSIYRFCQALSEISLYSDSEMRQKEHF